MNTSPLPQVMTATEASEWWGITSKTIINRMYARAVRLRDYESVIRRSGRVYLVAVGHCVLEFGTPPRERPIYE